LGRDFVRYLSAVVSMELRVGAGTMRARRAVDQLLHAYRSIGRLIAPTAEQFDRAGHALRRLRDTGMETRRASLVDDVLIAQTARGLGAVLCTADRDFERIRSVVDVAVQIVGP
jgi:predicted nucleic acid-binding protein